MKRNFIIVIVIVFVAWGLLAAKNMLAKAATEKIVGKITGLRLVIEDFDMGLIKTNLKIKGLLLFNPKQAFTDKIMLEVREIYIDYDLPRLLRKKLHFKKLRLNVSEFAIIKNADGELNLNSLKIIKMQKEEARPQVPKEDRLPEMQIDNLKLKIDRVVYKDYSQGPKPLVIEANLNIDETFKDIADPYSLIRLILIESIKKAALQQLIGINLEYLIKPIAALLKTTQQAGLGTITVIKEAGKQVTEAVKKTAEGLKESVQVLPVKNGPKEETGKGGE